MERQSRIIRSIWATCLILAGLNHARILFQHGLFWDYHGVSRASAMYWTSLTFIDPIVAALLFIRPKIGVPATVFVIATNVAHNSATTFAFVPDGAYFGYLLSSPQLMGQIGFLIVVLATWRKALEGVGKVTALSAD